MIGFKNIREPNLVSKGLAFLFQDTEEEYYGGSDTSVYRDAQHYQATRSKHLQALMDYLRLSDNDVFVDLGCGKGRVVGYAALHRIRKAIGVELRTELADHARRMLRGLPLASPVEIVTADAARYYTEEGTIYYLFNPFGLHTVADALENIRRSLVARPRGIRFVYNNSIHSYCVACTPWLVREHDLSGTDMVIWKNTGGERYSLPASNYK